MNKLIESISNIIEGVSGNIIFSDWTYANSKNPEVQVSGYGTLRYDQLKKMVIDDVKKLASRADDMRYLEYEIGHHSTATVLQLKISALKEVEEFMKTPQYKKMLKAKR